MMVTFLRMLIRILVPFLKRRRRGRRPGDSIECLVVGYGGANNTGAEARTAEAIKQMLDADPRITITLTSLNRSRTLRYLEEGERLGVMGINPVFVFSMARLVSAADVVVLAEGSCFKENFSPALFWFFMYSAELAHRLGIPVATYGVDAGPLTPKNAAWASLVAKDIGLLMVRTDAAKVMLRGMGIEVDVEVTTDTAFTLVPERREWAETVLAGQGIDLDRPVVGIAFEEFFWWPVMAKPLRALFGVKDDRYKSVYYHTWGRDGRAQSERMKAAIASYADWISSEYGAQVVFFAMESLDIGPCRDVMERMGSSSILIDADHASARQMAAFLRRLDWLVTGRYHALVLAMCGVTPTIGIGHDERIASIMDELGFLPDYFISHEEDDILALLKDKTLGIRINSDEIRERIESALPSYLARMARNQTLFSKFIGEHFGNQG